MKNSKRSDKIVSNLYTSVIALVWPMALALVITPMLVRGLGSDAYGVRGLIFTITGYFAILDLGLNSAGTKYLAQYIAINDRESVRELLGTTLTTFFTLGITGCVVIWFIAPWAITSFFQVPPSLHNESIYALRLSGLGFLLSMLVWWGSSIPTGLQRFDIFNWISVLFGSLTSIGSLAAVLLGYGLIGVVWANVVSNSIAVMLYWFSAKQLLPSISIHPSFEWKMFKQTVSFGSWSILFRVVGVFATQLDRIFIGVWLGTASLTYFLVPSQLASTISQMSGKLMQFVFPMASEISALGEKEKLRRLVLRSTNLTTIVGLSMAIPIIVLARPLLTFWIGHDFADKGSDVLQLLACAYCISTLTASPSSYLSGMGYPQIIFYAALLNTIFLIPCYYIFIRPFGIIGVPWAYLVASLPVVAFYWYYTDKATGISYRSFLKVIAKPLLIGIGVGLIVFVTLVPMIKNLIGVLLVASLIVMIYLIIVWITGTIESEEKLLLEEYFKQKYDDLINAFNKIQIMNKR